MPENKDSTTNLSRLVLFHTKRILATRDFFLQDEEQQPQKLSFSTGDYRGSSDFVSKPVARVSTKPYTDIIINTCSDQQQRAIRSGLQVVFSTNARLCSWDICTRGVLVPHLD